MSYQGEKELQEYEDLFGNLKRWAVAVLFGLLLSASPFLLNGCATTEATPVPGSAIKMGKDVEAPWGYTDLCKRVPDAPECGGAK